MSVGLDMIPTNIFNNKKTKLGEIYRQNDLEQATILLQNVTVSKKNFNFSIFKPKKLRLSKEVFLDEEDQEIEKKKRERDVEAISSVNLNDPIFEYYNINPDPNNKLLGDADYYRDINNKRED